MAAGQRSGANILNNIIPDRDVTSALNINSFLHQIMEIVVFDQDICACCNIDGDITYGINRIINATTESPGFGDQTPIVDRIRTAIKLEALDYGLIASDNQAIGRTEHVPVTGGGIRLDDDRRGRGAV